MKTRIGFVSNSSSSSFVCVMSKTDHDKIMSGLSEKHREFMKTYCKGCLNC